MITGMKVGVVLALATLMGVAVAIYPDDHWQYSTKLTPATIEVGAFVFLEMFAFYCELSCHITHASVFVHVRFGVLASR